MTGLLEIANLRLTAKGGTRPLLHGVTLSVASGEAVGLVGESGSGKSLTARSVPRLLPEGIRMHGRISFDGSDLGGLDARALRRFRANEVGMVFQDPRAHINPVRSIGDFLTEGLRTNGQVSRRAAQRTAISLLQEVGVADAPRRLRQWPHELSGGLLQRVMIASVLAAQPRLILADEPTTALDMTTQEEVMAILAELQRERGVALLLITHDLELASAICDRITVMYAGRIVETLPAAELETRPRHPYTAGLLGARPRLDGPRRRLTAVPGTPLAAYEVPEGCAFHTRCVHAEAVCRSRLPTSRTVGSSVVACHLAESWAPEEDQPDPGNDTGEERADA